MQTTIEIERAEQQAAALRAQADKLDHDLALGEVWTRADERRLAKLYMDAWRFDDTAATLRAGVALGDRHFADYAVSTLDTMPAGRPVLGDPGIWYQGREYWAHEVNDLYTAWQRRQASN